MQKFKTQTKKGSVLIFSLIVLSMMLVTAIGITTAGLAAKRSSLSAAKSVTAYQVADSGAEITLKIINMNGTSRMSENIWPAGASCSNSSEGPKLTGASVAGGTYTVYFNDAYGDPLNNCNQRLNTIGQIKVVGNYGNATRAVEVNMFAGAPADACGGVVSAAGRAPDLNTYGTVAAEDGRCWLDRNLGATRVATSLTDAQAYGWYYQWGRGTDGHQLSTSVTTSTLSPADNPGHDNFITSDPSFFGDWRSPQNNALWQGSSGINMPCPVGFHVPTTAEWDTLVDTAGITDVDSAFDSSLKLTSAGYRYYDDALIYNQDLALYYWGSSIYGVNYSSDIKFLSPSANPSFDGGRGNGFSVRCIKD